VAIMRGFLHRLWTNERAATAIEYTLIVGLISVAGISAFSTLGSKVLNMLGSVIP
jgi:Flp pilus assembly pilin Flp